MLPDLLINLRQMLLDARAPDDKALESELFITYDLLLEASYPGNNRALSGVLQNLKDAARDILNGEDWRSTIPTNEQIIQACQEGTSKNDD